jgi:predicted Rossmann fold flavoprotein
VSGVTHTFDAVILGGGAAGLMCAIEAGKRGRRVAVLEHADRLGKKILISGGGRCNFTNIHCSPENFLSANPHFAKSALARYTPADFIALVEKHRIPYHEKTAGQLFCDRSARDILTMLEEECRAAGVRIFLNVRIINVQSKEVRRGQKIPTSAAKNAAEMGHPFVVSTEEEEFRAPVLVVATGGMSIPKVGATAFGYELARQFGVKIREPRPGLVPFLFDDEDCSRYCDLAGISVEVVTSCDGQKFREKLLITHRGLSGPAVLQISSYWKPKECVCIDLAPEREITAAFRDPKSQRSINVLRAELRKTLPHRLADRWVDLHSPVSWTNSALAEFERGLHEWIITPAGTEGFSKAEVTVGGVDTDELSAKTMECRKVPGLYFIGEVVDVTGHLGGFNFQWAWASGAAAGRAL